MHSISKLSGICDFNRFRLSCLVPFDLLHPKTFKLFGFPIFRYWASPEECYSRNAYRALNLISTFLLKDMYIAFLFFGVKVMVCNATFNNITVISWRSVLLVEETGILREKHRSTYRKSLTNFNHPQLYRVHLAMSGIRTHNFSGVLGFFPPYNSWLVHHSNIEFVITMHFRGASRISSLGGGALK